VLRLETAGLAVLCKGREKRTVTLFSYVLRD
jgi:hypothetical protein